MRWENRTMYCVVSVFAVALWQWHEPSPALSSYNVWSCALKMALWPRSHKDPWVEVNVRVGPFSPNRLEKQLKNKSCLWVYSLRSWTRKCCFVERKLSGWKKDMKFISRLENVNTKCCDTSGCFRNCPHEDPFIFASYVFIICFLLYIPGSA